MIDPPQSHHKQNLWHCSYHLRKRKKLCQPKAEGECIRQAVPKCEFAKGLLRSEPVHSEECREFTLSELNAALKSLNPSKASGPDMIHPRLLHHLGPKAVNTLLRICNLSWSTMEIPQAWRVADVRPVLKAGKDAQCLDSYRTISLTSTMGKVMERLVTNRLRYFAECHNLHTPFQAGFRTGCSTEDQLFQLPIYQWWVPAPTNAAYGNGSDRLL